MEENLTPVNAGQEGVESPPVATGEGESAVAAEQQVTEEVKKEPEVKEQSREENAQYKALRLSEKQNAVDAEYAELAERNGWTKIDGKPIKTKADYEATYDAVQKKDALVLQGKSEREAVLEVQLQQREQRDAEKEAQTREQERFNREVSDFLKDFEETTGRKFSTTDKEELEKAGMFDIALKEKIPLRYAYADHLAQKRREEQKQIDAGKKASEINVKNAVSATGSITGGTSDGVEITQEMIDAHSNDTAWALKNYSAIEKFYKRR